MSRRLSGKIAVITGGANGIGAATARLFVANGARVVIGDVDRDGASDLVREHPDSIVFVETDVSVEANVDRLVHAAATEFGRLDIMFNNAATSGDRAPLPELTAEGFEHTVRLVAGSVLAGHRFAAAQFGRQNSGGSIISTASVASFQGAWAPAAYTIAKHAVIGIVRAATLELAPRGIRCNAIAPGAISTPGSARALGVPPALTAEFMLHLDQRTAGFQPVPRAGRPEDVANAALFLASDESEWISGAVIPVDGGATAVALGGGAPFGLPGSPSRLDSVVDEFMTGVRGE